MFHGCFAVFLHRSKTLQLYQRASLRVIYTMIAPRDPGKGVTIVCKRDLLSLRPYVQAGVSILSLPWLSEKTHLFCHALRAGCLKRLSSTERSRSQLL